jgi:hypothetical protein
MAQWRLSAVEQMMRVPKIFILLLLLALLTFLASMSIGMPDGMQLAQYLTTILFQMTGGDVWNRSTTDLEGG